MHLMNARKLMKKKTKSDEFFDQSGQSQLDFDNTSPKANEAGEDDSWEYEYEYEEVEVEYEEGENEESGMKFRAIQMMTLK